MSKHSNIPSILGDYDMDAVMQEAARRNMLSFSRYMTPDLDVQPFHRVYYTVLDMFAHGKIKKLIVQMPPQHGKSQGSSRMLPAYMLGLNPDLKIVIGSYAATIARDFNRDVQRIIDSEDYYSLFPETYLNKSNVVTVARSYLRNCDVIETVGHKGCLRVVGRGGSLTSKTADVYILDDVYKDYAEGNSPIVREASWKWYTTVVRTRIHNDSQELIVFTRWHKDDVIGRIEQSGEQIIEFTSYNDLNNVPRGAWLRINFEAIKTGSATEIDPREAGASLWEGRHSKERMLSQQLLDPVQFQCLYQGNPSSAEGRMYRAFKTWVDKADYGTYVRSGNYTDVADEGSDMLFSVCYDIYRSAQTIYNEKTRRWEPLLYALVTDMILTDANTDVTVVTVSEMINRMGTQRAWVESNGGGSQFGKLLSRRVKAQVSQFHQSANKESRIVTNAGMVDTCIVMPLGWESRFEGAYRHITEFLRNFSANRHDDMADGLTGVYEKEIASGNTQPYGQRVGVRIHN